MAPKQKARRVAGGGGSVRVFVSWSGKASNIVATELRTWLPTIIQSLDVFVSSQDLEKGVRWRSEINAQLAGAHFGIACLTPQNVDAPWVHFEAGALARVVEGQAPEPPLFTYLVGLKPSDIKGPLSEFQHTLANKDDTRALLRSLNSTVDRVTGRSLPKETIDSLFDTFWPKLDDSIKKALAISAPREVRSASDMLGEILDLVRSIDKGLSPWKRGTLLPRTMYPYQTLLGASAEARFKSPPFEDFTPFAELGGRQPTFPELATARRGSGKKFRNKQD